MRTAPYEQFMSKGTLLLLNSPQNLQLGFDNLSIKIGSKFKGIKMIPLGTHYLHFSLQQQNHMFKISQFIQFVPNQKIKILKWNQKAQDFMKINENQQTNYIEGVKQLHFDCHLVPYDNQKLKIWEETCSFINKFVLGKLDPVINIQNIQQEYGQKKPDIIEQPQMKIDDNQQYNQDNQPTNQQSSKQTNNKNVSNFKVIRGTIFYSQIPKKLKDSHQNTTIINLDKTSILKYVLKQQYPSNPNNILGQLQYSFVSFLLGQNLQSFEQWKKLLNLIIYSQQGVNQLSDLYLNFVIVLYNQIKQLPQDFFIDQISKNNFMVNCLIRLQEYQKDISINGKFKSRLRKLFEMIKHNFKYQIPIEDDEDMPVVVDNYEYL